MEKNKSIKMKTPNQSIIIETRRWASLGVIAQFPSRSLRKTKEKNESQNSFFFIGIRTSSRCFGDIFIQSLSSSLEILLIWLGGHLRSTPPPEVPNVWHS